MQTSGGRALLFFSFSPSPYLYLSLSLSRCSAIGRVGTRCVSGDEREEKRRRDCNSFIHHKVACDFLPASVIPHDLGGFSLKSKALADKTVQIEFDRY